jgi:murein L,D-transpeptidase YcbB/YkuD
VFSPTWNVPARIAREETVPAIRKDQAYLSRQRLDVFRRTRQGVVPVDPDEIDWSSAEEVNGLLFRQRPGAGNALGHVKFLFPNPYDVYLHDTPNDAAFARRSRALSHGCVRVSDPARLAEYVLRDQSPWDPASIKAAMGAGRERHVKLAQDIPVHIAYFTAWPQKDGTIAFFDDVYQYDARQAQRPDDE